MKHFITRTALAAVALIAVVACGGTTPATSIAPSTRPIASSPAVASPSSAAVPSVSSPTTPAVTAPASTIPNLPSMGPIFSSHSDPTLEALLPATVSGTAMHRYSLSLTELLDEGGDRAGITAFLQTLNKTEADGSFASAFDPTNSMGGGINAFKVAGADAAALLAGITTVEVSDLGTDATSEQATVGNKNVTVVSVGDGVNDTKWIYGLGDVVFVVAAPDAKGAAAYLEALP